MKNYDGLYTSNFTVQLPYGKDIVLGCYDEGYDWAWGIWDKGYSMHYTHLKKCGERFMDAWMNKMSPMSKIDFEEYLKTHDWDDPFPSNETLSLMRALERGTDTCYDPNGDIGEEGFYDTSKLASDMDMALYDGAYTGYLDACHAACEAAGVEMVEEED